MNIKVAPILLGLAILALAWVAIRQAAPDPVQFKPVSRQAFLGTLSWLFVVALFIERAVEVIVSTLRDAEADLRQHAIDTAQEKIDAQAKVTPGVVPYLTDLNQAQEKLVRYRADTKELALCTSFLLGLFVSLAGVRAFDSIALNAPSCNVVFTVADIIVTGAVLAGGTEAIHRMANVFTNFMDSAANKAGGNS